MTLYEIEAQILECASEVDEETGEILDIEKLEALEIEKEKKQENIALWIKNLRAEKEAVKSEKMSLADRQKKLENKISNLEAYLKDSLDGQKLTTAKVAVTYRKTVSVNVTDASQIPHEFLRFKEPEADKTAIKKALKDGVEIAGAELVDNISMSIK